MFKKYLSVNIKARMPKPKTFTVCKSLANLWEGAHSPPPPPPLHVFWVGKKNCRMKKSQGKPNHCVNQVIIHY